MNLKNSSVFSASWLFWAKFLCSILFIFWSLSFIQHSSIVLKNGTRYYHLFDDAMISMRYAWNFAHGEGLTWNTNYSPVEGYSNPLMVFLMASVIKVLEDKSLSCLGIQLLGIIFVLSVSFLAAQLTQRLLPLYPQTTVSPQLFVFLAFFFTLTAYPLLYYSLMGMENGLLALLLMLALNCIFQDKKNPSLFFIVPGLLALMMLTRPDAIIAVLPIFLFYLYEHRLGSKKKWIASILIFLVPLFLLVLFRWLYYKQWIPNTALLKLGVPFQLRWPEGWLYSQKTIQHIFGIVPCIFIGISVLGKPDRRKMLLFSFFPLLITYQLWTGGDCFQTQRFPSHFLGVFFVLLIVAIFEGIHWLNAHLFIQSSLKRWGSPVFVFLSIGFLVWSFQTYFFSLANFIVSKPFPNSYYEWEEENLIQHKTNLKISLAVKDATLSPKITMGVLWAGMTYYAETNGVDFLGKCDPYIASLPPNPGVFSPGHSKYNLLWSTSFYLPDVIYTNSWTTEFEKMFRDHPELYQKYQDFRLFYLKSNSPYLDSNKFLQQILFY
ncbi:MAG: hypothetical protein AABZ60_03605 [Planctomycetota bacterium]